MVTKVKGWRERPFADAIRMALVANRSELAQALGITQQGLWNLEHGRHARAPVRLLRLLAKALARRGMLDGSAPPTLPELLQAWVREHA